MPLMFELCANIQPCVECKAQDFGVFCVYMIMYDGVFCVYLIMYDGVFCVYLIMYDRNKAHPLLHCGEDYKSNCQ